MGVLVNSKENQKENHHVFLGGRPQRKDTRLREARAHLRFGPPTKGSWHCPHLAAGRCPGEIELGRFSCAGNSGGLWESEVSKLE